MSPIPEAWRKVLPAHILYIHTAVCVSKRKKKYQWVRGCSADLITDTLAGMAGTESQMIAAYLTSPGLKYGGPVPSAAHRTPWVSLPPEHKCSVETV